MPHGPLERVVRCHCTASSTSRTLCRPETSWRYVFLCGLIPAAVAFVIRLFIREPARWKDAAAGVVPPRLRELFAPGLRARTMSGFSMALVALVTWWSTNAFIPIVSTGLAQAAAKSRGLDVAATRALIESWKAHTTSYFNLGGLIGTLLTIPASKFLGRKKMFALYYALSGLALFATFHLDLAPEVRQRLYFFVGLTVFGVFGAFTYYLPELFPTRLRATGAGFCYNVGRLLTAVGPFLVGHFASRGPDALAGTLSTLTFVAIVPIAGLLFMPIVIETRGSALE